MRDLAIVAIFGLFWGHLCAQTPQEAYVEGLKYYREGSYKQALKFFDKATAFDAGKSAFYQAQCCYYLKDYQAALLWYGKVLEQKPRDVDGLYGRARTYHALKQTDSALSDLSLLFQVYPDNVFLYYLRGRCYQEKQDFESAIRDYRSALNLKSSFDKAYQRLGECYFSQQKFEESLFSFEKALERGGDIAEICYTRAQVYLAMRPGVSEAVGKAREDLKTVLAINPGNGPAWRQLADLYREQKKYEEALSAYTHALSLDGANTPCYRSRGIVYYELKQYREARSDFEKILAETPQDPEVTFYLGCILAQMGEDDKAIEYFTEVVEVQYNYWEAYFRRGELYLKKGEYAKAFKNYDALMEWGYDGDRSRVDLGRAEAKRGMGTTKDDEDALRYYGDSILANPQCAPAYSGIGKIKERQGKYGEALQSTTKAIDLDSANIEYYRARGMIYYRIKRYEAAVEDFTHAIKLGPTHVHYYYRGLAYHAGNDLVAANEDFSKAIEIKRDFADAYRMRGQCYPTNPNRALQDYNKALDLAPEDAVTYNLRGLTYYMSGILDRAEADFTEAVKLRENPEFYYNRAKVYVKMKKYPQARDDCTRGLNIEENKKLYELRAEVFKALGEHDKAREDEISARAYR